MAAAIQYLRAQLATDIAQHIGAREQLLAGTLFPVIRLAFASEDLRAIVDKAKHRRSLRVADVIVEVHLRQAQVRTHR